MRVRSGRFNKLARTTKFPMSSQIAQNLGTSVPDAEQTLFLEPCNGHGLLGDGGSCHVSVTQAADAMLDGGFEHYPEIESVRLRLRNPIVDPARRQRMRRNLRWLAGRLGEVPFIRYGITKFHRATFIRHEKHTPCTP